MNKKFIELLSEEDFNLYNEISESINSLDSDIFMVGRLYEEMISENIEPTTIRLVLAVRKIYGESNFSDAEEFEYVSTCLHFYLKFC
jgi:hypothetical protein